MANPKRRHSQQRTNLRRAHWKLNPPNYSTCPQCKKPKLPHRACLECGYYNGEMVLKIKQPKPQEPTGENKQQGAK